MTYMSKPDRPSRAEQRARLLRMIAQSHTAYKNGSLSPVMWGSIRRQAKDLGISDKEFNAKCHR